MKITLPPIAQRRLAQRRPNSVCVIDSNCDEDSEWAFMVAFPTVEDATAIAALPQCLESMVDSLQCMIGVQAHMAEQNDNEEWSEEIEFLDLQIDSAKQALLKAGCTITES